MKILKIWSLLKINYRTQIMSKDRSNLIEIWWSRNDPCIIIKMTQAAVKMKISWLLKMVRCKSQWQSTKMKTKNNQNTQTTTDKIRSVQNSPIFKMILKTCLWLSHRVAWANFQNRATWKKSCRCRPWWTISKLSSQRWNHTTSSKMGRS